MKYRVCAALCALLTSVVVRATPYWVEYDASSGAWPELENWTRVVYGGGAERWFEDDTLVIDSRASMEIEDSYAMERPGQLDPSNADEWFVMTWRLRIDELEGLWDPRVSVFSDERRAVFLDFSLDGVHVPGEGFVATFEPGVFHDFEFRSASMLTYDLYIDNSMAYSGSFTVPLLTRSRVAWGDGTSGGASLSRWEGFAFGVVPEPKSALVGVALLAVARAAGRGVRR